MWTLRSGYLDEVCMEYSSLQNMHPAIYVYLGTLMKQSHFSYELIR